LILLKNHLEFPKSRYNRVRLETFRVFYPQVAT
jgi:hypothetical protein